jgi:hypothetical protein
MNADFLRRDLQLPLTGFRLGYLPYLARNDAHAKAQRARSQRCPCRTDVFRVAALWIASGGRLVAPALRRLNATMQLCRTDYPARGIGRQPSQ